MAKQVDILKDLNISWGTPKRVNTKQGPRDLHKAPATENFWLLWKKNKEELKNAGISVSKEDTGAWCVMYWAPIPEQEQKEITEKIEASKSVDANVEIPVNPGLKYMGFQKAGIKYALERTNTLISDE